VVIKLITHWTTGPWSQTLELLRYYVIYLKASAPSHMQMEMQCYSNLYLKSQESN